MNNKRIGFALSCIDYRLIDKTIDLLQDIAEVDSFDSTILAGASLGFNQDKYKCWQQTLVDHIDLAIKLHKIIKIAIIDHEDCGAYKLFFPEVKDNKELEKEYHIKNVEKCIENLKKLYPDLIYSGYLLKLDGSYEKIV